MDICKQRDLHDPLIRHTATTPAILLPTSAPHLPSTRGWLVHRSSPPRLGPPLLELSQDSLPAQARPMPLPSPERLRPRRRDALLSLLHLAPAMAVQAHLPTPHADACRSPLWRRHRTDSNILGACPRLLRRHRTLDLSHRRTWDFRRPARNRLCSHSDRYSLAAGVASHRPETGRVFLQERCHGARSR